MIEWGVSRWKGDDGGGGGGGSKWNVWVSKRSHQKGWKNLQGTQEGRISFSKKYGGLLLKIKE